VGDQCGRSDINGISVGMSIWDMGYRFGMRYIDMIIYHIVMVILDIDMGYGLMIRQMTVSIRSSSASIWDILSLCEWKPLPLASKSLSMIIICSACCSRVMRREISAIAVR